MASGGKIEIEKFNGQRFELWKLKMEDLLVDKDQWVAVDPGTKPTTMSDEDWKKLDRKAKSTIRLCGSDSVLLNLFGEATAKTLWDKLGNLYQSKSLGSFPSGAKWENKILDLVHSDVFGPMSIPSLRKSV